MESQKDILKNLYKKYEEYKSQNLQINMARGKPCNSQLNLSNELLNIKINYKTKENFDARNYGCLDGLLECKELFSEILDIKKENIIICGNSTLNTIYDIISRLYIWGTNGEKPWSKYEKIKFICPCPGYDRHFDILEKFGIEMIPIQFENGQLNIDKIEKLCLKDESIKGIICVPVYSNPTGICYSNKAILRLAKMKTKAKDFKIFWDNAYAIHHIYKKIDCLNLLKESEKFGNADRVLYFFSTSKITFAGGGVSVFASGKNMIEETKKHMSVQTIGYDKINQLKTVAFLKNKENTLKLMDKHAEILREKFDIVLNKLEKNFENGKILKWEKPLGGYFISVNTEKGCAKKVVKACKDLGLILTDAGSTYPKKLDIEDTNIRIAPSFPEKEELEKGMDIFCLCVKIVSIENSL